MSHLHLVDGVISPIWWILGYLISGGILLFALSRIKKDDLAKKVPYIGVIGALMLITMSVPLGILPFHLNLTVIAGILAGPWIGFTAVFIVNLILAFIGHGGITVVGLNTLVIGTEVILGYYLFMALKKWAKPGTAVALTVIMALLISTTFMVGIVVATDAGLVSALPHFEEEHAEEEVFSNEGEDLQEHLSEMQIFNISGWGAVTAILLLGIAIEAAVSFMVVSYLIKVRPDMIILETVAQENSGQKG